METPPSIQAALASTSVASRLGHVENSAAMGLHAQPGDLSSDDRSPPSHLRDLALTGAAPCIALRLSGIYAEKGKEALPFPVATFTPPTPPTHTATQAHADKQRQEQKQPHTQIQQGHLQELPRGPACVLRCACLPVHHLLGVGKYRLRHEGRRCICVCPGIHTCLGYCTLTALSALLSALMRRHQLMARVALVAQQRHCFMLSRALGLLSS